MDQDVGRSGVAVDPGLRYLGDLDAEAFARAFAQSHPDFADALWLDRPGAAEVLRKMVDAANEFETDAGAGRGDSYRHAQRVTAARLTGIRTLFGLALGDQELRCIPFGWRLLDVLGGDGLIARALNMMRPGLTRQPVLTSDVAESMILHACAQGLPAIREPAEYLFLRDASFDAVLIAYGTHHIDPLERPDMCRDAFRVLRPHGRIVLHDFECGSAVARWFDEVVDRWSLGGHQYRHFTRAEFRTLLEDAGFSDVEVRQVYDPISLRGHSAREATDSLLDYLIAMYGLRRLVARGERGRRWLYEWLRANMQCDLDAVVGLEPNASGQLTARETEAGWVASMPRIALVATGTKPEVEGPP